MARSGANMTELSTLKAITFRLSSTNPSQLPQQVPTITASLASCKFLLSSIQPSGTKTSSDASVAVHKYRTLLSTLLQDRTFQARWTAIVLIKATVEIGGWETLQKSLPWVRGLLGVLSKPDPPSSKKLCLITLTRIFTLTREFPTLVREITTPSLPTFVQLCIQSFYSKATASIVLTALECLNQLLPRHPTIFRTCAAQLQRLLGSIMAPTPSSSLPSEQSHAPEFQPSSEVATAARRLYAQLPCCTAKGGSSEEWERALRSVIANAHRIADKVFRGVIEDWHPSHGPAPTVDGHITANEVQDLVNDAMDLPCWSGLHAGAERLATLVSLIKEYLLSPTSSTVSIKLGQVVDLVIRMLLLTVPSSTNSKAFHSNVKFNNQISKEERETLWTVLPHLHTAAIELLLAISYRCESSAYGLDFALLDQLAWVFDSEEDDVHIRAACYLAVENILERSGPSLPKSSVDSLGALTRTCCDDLLPEAIMVSRRSKASSKSGLAAPQLSSANADTFLTGQSAPKDPVMGYVGLQRAAHNLLASMLTNIRPHHLSDSLRARIDRTAILTQDKEAMFASSLNPPPKKTFGKPTTSILPLMARSNIGDKSLEAVIRPRMPIISIGSKGFEDENHYETPNDIEKESDEERFIGEELNTLLETATHGRNPEGDIEVTITDSLDKHATPIDVPRTIALQAQNEENTVEPFACDPVIANRSNKRPQYDHSPLSPTKRSKIEQINKAPISFEPATVTTVATQSSELLREKSPFSTLVPNNSLPQSTPLPLPTANAALSEGESDDNDDFGELILGQDTDDEAST